MPWPEKLPSGRWRARWWGADGKKKSGKQTYTARSDALLEAIEEERRAKDGQPDVDRGLTWRTWHTEWTTKRLIAASTREITSGVISKWVMPYWGDRKISTITSQQVRDWVAKIQVEGASAWTTIKAYNQLSNSLKMAVEAGKLRENPCHTITLPTPRRGRGMAFEIDEVEAIIDQLLPPYSWAVMVLAYMGLRFGEMAGMHWADVDSRTRMLYVSHTWDRHGRMINPVPKDKEERWVPIPDQLLPLFDSRPDNWDVPCGLVHSAHDDPCPGRLILPGAQGAALDGKNMMRRQFQPAMVKAGIDPERFGRQHDLRHSFITWLITEGMTAEEVAPLVGHSSTWVTEKYRHLLSGHGEKARSAISALGRGAGPLPHAGAVGGNSAPRSAPRPRLTVVRGAEPK